MENQELELLPDAGSSLDRSMSGKLQVAKMSAIITFRINFTRHASKKKHVADDCINQKRLMPRSIDDLCEVLGCMGNSLTKEQNHCSTFNTCFKECPAAQSAAFCQFSKLRQVGSAVVESTVDLGEQITVLA